MDRVGTSIAPRRGAKIFMCEKKNLNKKKILPVIVCDLIRARDIFVTCVCIYTHTRCIACDIMFP